MKWGAGLRASQALVLGGKARALMHGRYHVSVEDIQALAQADPAPPHHDELLRRVRAHQLRTRSSSGCSRPCRCRRAGCKRCRLRPRATASFSTRRSIARLGTLELKARTIVEGFLSGLHRSPFKGFSVEFAEYRQYMPGDDLSTIDWKVYARSDRHYVKKFEEETNLDCHLLLDVSGSMGYGSRAAMTKFEYGACLAASLALPDEPAARRGRPDRVRRAASSPMLPASARPGHLHALLLDARAAAARARGPNVAEAAAPARRRARASAAWSC